VSTFILRLQETAGGLRGTVEVPGGEPSTFQSDEELLDTLYEWSSGSGDIGKGSGSTSSSAIRAT
jgi:hypothetical protein